MEARYSLNCLPDSRVGTSTRFRWKSFPRESSRSATARQAGLSQDRKSRFMAGKQDSPERGKGGDYGRIIPCRGVFSHLFFQGCREGDGRSRSVRGFSGVLALREGCLFLYPSWRGIFSCCVPPGVRRDREDLLPRREFTKWLFRECPASLNKCVHSCVAVEGRFLKFPIIYGS